MEPQDDEQAPPVRLLGKGGWQERNADRLPSGEAAKHLLRHHKAELVNSGALGMLFGQWHVLDERRLIRALHDIAKLNARAKLLDDEAKEVQLRRRTVKAFEGMLNEERSALRKAEIALGIEETTPQAPG